MTLKFKVFGDFLARFKLYSLVSESRLNGVTAISIIGEVPKGRDYILKNKLGQIKKLLNDSSDLVRAAASECCQVIEWKP